MVTALSGTQTFDATVTLNLATSANFAVSNSAEIALAATVSGSGALSLTGDGTGTLVLSGTANTYSGGTYVDAGTLIANNSGAVPNGSSLTVGAGSVFIFDPMASVASQASASPAGVSSSRARAGNDLVVIGGPLECGDLSPLFKMREENLRFEIWDLGFQISD